jgi:hypothetical protein
VVDGNAHLVKAVAGDGHDEAWHVARFPTPPGPAATLILLSFARALAALAKRAGVRPGEPIAAG